jgi:hypothetical protein
LANTWGSHAVGRAGPVGDPAAVWGIVTDSRRSQVLWVPFRSRASRSSRRAERTVRPGATGGRICTTGRQRVCSGGESPGVRDVRLTRVSKPDAGYPTRVSRTRKRRDARKRDIKSQISGERRRVDSSPIPTKPVAFSHCNPWPSDPISPFHRFCVACL